MSCKDFRRISLLCEAKQRKIVQKKIMENYRSYIRLLTSGIQLAILERSKVPSKMITAVELIW